MPATGVTPSVAVHATVQPFPFGYGNIHYYSQVRSTSWAQLVYIYSTRKPHSYHILCFLCFSP